MIPRPIYPDLEDPNTTMYEAYKHANESARMLIEAIRTHCISELINDPTIFTSWDRMNSMLQVLDQLVNITEELHLDTNVLMPEQKPLYSARLN